MSASVQTETPRPAEGEPETKATVPAAPSIVQNEDTRPKDAALKPIKRDRRFALLRDYLKHEDSLINHRITWNLQVQGFLFTAFGVVISIKPPELPVLSQLRERYLPLAGFAISVSALAGIFAAHLAIRRLARQWDGGTGGSGGNGPTWLPELAGGGARLATNIGLLAGFGPPIVIAAIWSTIFLQALAGHPEKLVFLQPLAAYPKIASLAGSGLLLLMMVVVDHLCAREKTARQVDQSAVREIRRPAEIETVTATGRRESMMSTRSDLLTEYKLLRAEIAQNSRNVAAAFRVNTTVTALLVGYGVHEVHSGHYGVFLAPLAVLIPTLYFIASQLESTTHISQYLRIMLEPDLGIKWQTHWYELRFADQADSDKKEERLVRKRKYVLSVSALYGGLGAMSLVLAVAHALIDCNERHWQLTVTDIGTALVVGVGVGFLIHAVSSVNRPFTPEFRDEVARRWEELKKKRQPTEAPYPGSASGSTGA